MVIVVDPSGRMVCNATVTSSAGGATGLLQQCTRADASCAYCQAGGRPGSNNLTATAPGYRTSSTTVDLTADSCGLIDFVSNVTMQITPSCSTPTTHDNGLGQQWSDCTSAGTYTALEATTACETYPGSYFTCLPTTCNDDAGVSGQEAVCTSSNSPGITGPCDCWAFSGTGAGHVSISDAGCVCATNTDPSWR